MATAGKDVAAKRPPRSARGRLQLSELIGWLADDGLIAAEQATRLRSRLRPDPDTHPLVTLSKLELSDPREPQRKLGLEGLTAWLAERSGIPHFRIDPLTIDVPSVTGVVAYAYAVRAGILPVQVSDEAVTIASAEPAVDYWVADLEQILKQPVRRVLSNPEDISRYQVEFYALARSVKASEGERKGVIPGTSRNLEQLMELGRAGKLDANDQHVVNIVDWLLQYAFEQRASDIHLEPRRDTGNIRFRIDGVLHEVYQVPDTVMAAITSRLKILGRMDVAEKRRPQDGRIKTRNPDGREIELRASSLPTAFGEKLVLRIFDPEVLVRGFADLGFPEASARTWQDMLRQSHGIILVTGPTGSGKTTTLYSSLKQLATSKVNVCTIEDPIELVEPSFNQMQVQPNIELGFADGVRAMLRQDPDIIMIGEIRDLETAEIAVQAALTGHLVLSTLHTNDAPSAITRLMELGVPPYLLRATVIGVLAQRLARRLCPQCRTPVEISESRWQDLVGGWPLPRPDAAYEPNGCLACRETGFYGRSGLYELLPMSDALRERISEQPDTVSLRRLARDEGMEPLRIAGARRIANGETSVEEVLRTTPGPGPG